MIVTPLGSMGWIPTGPNHTCCFSVEIDGRLVILDAGTGIARFSGPVGQAILKQYQEIVLILSHYHLDHITGLIYIPAFFAGKTLHIAGPGRQFYPDGIEAILNGMIRPPYFSQPLTHYPLELHLHELVEGSNLVAGLELEVIRQHHTDPSIGVKLGNDLCYMTDTGPTDATVAFCRHTRLLMHECFMDQDDRRDDTTHTGVEDVTRIAREAAVEHLMMVHLNPRYPEKRLLAMEAFARSIFPAASLAKDCISVTI